MRILTFQSAKTDITYAPHARRIYLGVASLPKKTAAQRKALAL
jgi:hypothetical protein